jgi:hypothetical protein
LTRIIGEPVFASDIAEFRGNLVQLLRNLGLGDGRGAADAYDAESGFDADVPL